MWSTDFSGRYGAFSPQQRLLFPVRDSADVTKKSLLRALLHGTCTGVAVLAPEDRAVLLLVRQTLLTVSAKNPLLQRSGFIIAVTTSAAWAIETLSDRVHDVAGHLQVDTLDILLLTRPPSLESTVSTSQRKQIVLDHWDAMCSVHQRGLVRIIGASDFTIQEMEFMFTASPSSPPTVLSVRTALAPTRPPAAQLPTPDVPLRSVVSFAHGRRMDVIVRLAYRALDDLSAQIPLCEQWRQLVDTIAQRQRTKQFDVQVVHEVEQDAYHLEKRDMAETRTLQTGTQIVLRYLLQKGVVVVPLPESQDSGDHFSEDESHEVFYELMHPFTEAPPGRSPQVQYASVLSKDELQLIDHVVPLVVAFSDP